MTTETKLILQKLDAIQSELHSIKVRMFDEDTILTEDDREAIKKADEDLRLGKTKRL